MREATQKARFLIYFLLRLWEDSLLVLNYSWTVSSVNFIKCITLSDTVLFASDLLSHVNGDLPSFRGDLTQHVLVL